MGFFMKKLLFSVCLSALILSLTLPFAHATEAEKNRGGMKRALPSNVQPEDNAQPHSLENLFNPDDVCQDVWKHIIVDKLTMEPESLSIVLLVSTMVVEK
jgi:hypothetical protein